jgi:hypothetical protein
LITAEATPIATKLMSLWQPMGVCVAARGDDRPLGEYMSDEMR